MTRFTTTGTNSPTIWPSSLWFGGPQGVRFVPVESVYAVFEVKPELKKKYVTYAVDEVRSVRLLDRPSADLIPKGGTYDRATIDVKPIIGVLAVGDKWAAETTLDNLDKYQPADPADDRFLSTGIALDTLCFDYTPTLDGTDAVAPRTVSAPASSSPTSQSGSSGSSKRSARSPRWTCSATKPPSPERSPPTP